GPGRTTTTESEERRPVGGGGRDQPASSCHGRAQIGGRKSKITDMKIFLFLFRISRRALMLSVLSGFFAGISSAGLIVVINTSYGRGSTRGLILSFAGLGILMLVSNLISRLMLVQ